MTKNAYNEYRPEIVGMDWTPGSLILVGSLWFESRHYVLGNCIVQGTKEDISVAYFAPDGNAVRLKRLMLQMQKEIKDYPLYIDDTPHMSISYIIERTFHLVGSKDVGLVVIDCLQKVDSNVLGKDTKEEELNNVLRLFKAMAEALGIVIIVTSKLSDHISKNHRRPEVRDLLDITEADSYCDQIILFHDEEENGGTFKMILPLGHPWYHGEFGEMVINVIKDKEKLLFKKAESLPQDEKRNHEYEGRPMYEWYQLKQNNSWHFEFLDAEGMGWGITVEHISGTPPNQFIVYVTSWAGDDICLVQKANCENVDGLKQLALNKARECFPDVEILEKTLSLKA
jgi:hypothetical protein